MPLAQMGYKSLFKVVFHLLQRCTAVAVVKVSNPTPYLGVELLHYPLKRHDRPRSPGEVGYTVFDRLQ